MSNQEPMTKPSLIARLADQADVDKKTATAVLDALTDIITTTVAEGGAVTIPGIGKIFTRPRPIRMVRNPAAGEKLEKSADRVVKVTVSKTLKDAVNDV